MTKLPAFRDPHVKAGWRYAEQVVAGKIKACRYVRLACERAINDFARQKTPEFPYKFDQKKAARVCEFLECLPHVKGPMGGTPLRLEGWQCFALGQLFGWNYDRGHLENRRRFRKSYLEVAKGNGKTLILAGLALYMLTCQDDPGAEVYSSAVSKNQAELSWKTAYRMCQLRDDLRTELGIRLLQHEIRVERTASKYVATSSEAGTLHGMNVSFSGMDELGEHPNSQVYDAIETACAKRPEPLMFSITTAGSDMSSIGYRTHEYVADILNGTFIDESFFGMIYALDPADQWDDPDVWFKANPCLGVSVYEHALVDDCTKAKNSPTAQAAFKTYHCNVWVATDTPFYNLDSWVKCADKKLTLNDFEGQRAVIGLDLASKRDLTAKVLVFPKIIDNKYHYYLFASHYLPHKAIYDGRNPRYQGFYDMGRIIKTGGDITDFEKIENDIIDDCKRFNVTHVAFDPDNATYLVTRLMDRGIPMIEFRPIVRNFNEPMKELDAISIDGRLHFDGDPLLLWQAGNVVAHIDKKDSVYPNKENAEKKIDGIVATISAIGVILNEPILEAPYSDGRPMAFCRFGR